MKKTRLSLWLPLLLILLVFMVSCAPGNIRFDATPAGFWYGLWHGFISLFSFIISLFSDNFRIYETNNSGWSYDLGFILGIMIFYGGGTRSSCRRW